MKKKICILIVSLFICVSCNSQKDDYGKLIEELNGQDNKKAKERLMVYGEKLLNQYKILKHEAQWASVENREAAEGRLLKSKEMIHEFAQTLKKHAGNRNASVCMSIKEINQYLYSLTQPRIVFSKSYKGGNSEIWIIGSDGKNLKRVTKNDRRRDEEPSWHPNGTKIVFSSDRDHFTSQIYVVDADGKNLRKLTNERPRHLAPVYSPDGSQIAFESLEKVFEDNHPNNYDVYIMDANGNNQRNLTGDYKDAMHITLVGWNPDGTKIAFHVMRISGSSGIYIMDADGKNHRKLSGDNYNIAGDCAWSPDGKKMVFCLRDESGTGLGIIDADGSNFKRIVKNINVPSLSWSFDNRQIILSAFDGEAKAYKLYTLDADGQNLRELLDELPNNNADVPITHPASKDMIFLSSLMKPGAVIEIWSTNIESKKLTKVGMSYMTPKPSWEPVILNEIASLFSDELDSSLNSDNANPDSKK
ncbi:MAG: hypothetical protein AB1599_04255 [Planctomycetota bacterium]